MARKIAAIDIGSHSVKVVLARERFGKIEPLRFSERPLTNGNVQELIRSILQEGGLHPDVVVSSVPGNTVSVHYLKIPFTDEGKIGKVIPYEVEGLVPFPLEEMVIDQFILSKGNGAKPDNGSSVCVGLIKKSELQRHMDTLKGASVDAKVIELESLALYHAFMQWYKIEDTVALLDIGAARSNLCIVSKGKPRYVRTFNRGGNGITSAIQETLGLSFEEAEAKKLSSAIRLSKGEGDENPPPPFDSAQGVLNPLPFKGRDRVGMGLFSDENADQEDIISPAIKRGIAPFMAELQQSLHAYEIQHNDEITRLYISGGGARLRNIDRFLAAGLSTEVDILSPPKDVIEILQGGEDSRFTVPTGMGLAFCGARKRQVAGLNFRKGEHFSRKEAKETRWRLIYVIIAVIAITILGAVDFYYKYQQREGRYTAIKSEMRKLYMETFPGARNIVDEVQQLKSAVDELRKKVEALGGGSKNSVTSLDILNTISEKIPKDIVVSIDDLMIDKNKIRIQGDTDSFESVERMKKEFEAIPFFKKIDVGDAKLSADQKKVKFRIIVDM